MNLLKNFPYKSLYCGLLALTISVVSNAQTYASLTAEQQQAEQLLERDILISQGGLKPLGKTTRMYSYFRPAKNSSQNNQLWPTYLKASSQLNQFSSDISLFSGAFWNPENTNTDQVNGGPGWYLAAEPVVSESFGYAYYIADFPAELKVLDVTDPTWAHISKIPLNPETLQKLISSGVITKKQVSLLGFHKGYFSRLSMQNIAHPELKTYREVLTNIFKKQNIQLVAYTWEKTGLKGLCKRATRTALVYMGQQPTKALNRATLDTTLAQGLVLNFPSGNLADFEYTADQIQKVEEANKLYQAVKSASFSQLSEAEKAKLKSLTYECE